jgi:hypothetical protein
MSNARRKPAQTIAETRRRIAEMDYVCSGTLLRRIKTCGKTTCGCAQDPEARHGPYYEWSRLQKGRLVHTILSADEGRRIAQAIRNYRLLRRLVRVWERATLSAIRDSVHRATSHDIR